MKTLYLGLRAPNAVVTHYPIIKIYPRSPKIPGITLAFEEMAYYTHIILTSQTAVKIFFDYLTHFNQNCTQKIIAVGQKTTQAVEKRGYSVSHAAEEETAEGIVALLRRMELKDAYFFWPHSALSRAVLTDYFEENKIKFRSCILYDTKPYQSGPLPCLDDFDEIVFTSPSTVTAFRLFFGGFPKGKRLTSIGPITRKALNQSRLIC